MYFIYVSNDVQATDAFENVLHKIDRKKVLITVPNGYELIQFLQNVKKGESYPDLIILTPDHLRISGKELLELLKVDDIYCLIPVVMLFHERINTQDEAFCRQLGTEFMLAPKAQPEWMSAVKKMCAVCS